MGNTSAAATQETPILRASPLVIGGGSVTCRFLNAATDRPHDSILCEASRPQNVSNVARSNTT